MVENGQNIQASIHYRIRCNFHTTVWTIILFFSGSHDSGAYWLDRAGGIAEDEPSIIRTLANSCCCGISVVYQWALTQNLSVKGQLEHGVRYLDLRLCGRPGSPDVHVAHGLYGHRLHDILLEIKEFMDENQKEFVILDFNHFHNMTSVDHREVLILIIKIFGVQILGGDTPMSAWSITLDNLWKTPARLMVFYGHPARNEFSFFWSEEYLQSPWANTTSSSALVRFHENNYYQSVRRGEGEFYVWQGVLTPSTGTVIGNLCSSLERKLVPRATSAFLDWIKDKVPSRVGINICCADFVEKYNFIPSILSLNKNIQT